MKIKAFYDSDTSTVTYVLADPATGKAAIIDSVQDYDPQGGRTRFTSADAVIDYIKAERLSVEWILETHIHADHLTAAAYLKLKLGGKIAMGEGVKSVLAYWVPLFGTASDTPIDGSQYDHLFQDGEVFAVGSLSVRVMATPGHTPACVVYIVNDEAVFLGDTLFMPAVGASRADFPGGNAATLYRSIQKIYALPDHVTLYVCHDYPAAGQQPAWQTTVGEEKASNKLLPASVSEADFVAARRARDVTLPVPKLLLPSIQMNMRCGNAPKPDASGISRLHIPLNQI